MQRGVFSLGSAFHNVIDPVHGDSVFTSVPGEVIQGLHVDGDQFIMCHLLGDGSSGKGQLVKTAFHAHGVDKCISSVRRNAGNLDNGVHRSSGKQRG